ncbi:hypothetical protein WM16_30480 [Burkholderia ubonensis]|uniref:DUF2933 domain-containing protein n=1 Tax=Burkholderia ubonensis TaxID=101571 RepID=A0A107ITE7_9BURK|nr:DUF2933 domain-containing protein [Burkholderia ubonensis]KWE60391.1 hypothetical protein WL77_26775 [Burkholderia ubonensis]KWE78108.1 hypothetical protein WL79_06235 [Burkholderia ubonensis]KWK85708.1 hypothetical protein WM16_30480 [Burkholderia ubonensis]
MKCNLKTMVTIALVLVAAIAIGYWALPQSRSVLATLAVIAGAFICPLSMLFMMRGMHSHTDAHDQGGRLNDEAKR